MVSLSVITLSGQAGRNQLSCTILVRATAGTNVHRFARRPIEELETESHRESGYY
jgi:hypothetical protein